jgi:hypothetical protein
MGKATRITLALAATAAVVVVWMALFRAVTGDRYAPIGAIGAGVFMTVWHFTGERAKK